MKYFIDTEFSEDGRTIDLISIGIVSEDGREYYAESIESDLLGANDWVKENVIPKLGPVSKWKYRDQIAQEILAFTQYPETPEFWGYYADYDWVALCQLYGPMVELPEKWPKFCNDLKQLCDSLGNPRLPAADDEHHALTDARWNREAWIYLNNYGI